MSELASPIQGSTEHNGFIGGAPDAAAQFSILPPTQRVEAVLASVVMPVTKEAALEYAGVSVGELNDEEQAVINAVFDDPNVQSSEHNDSELGVTYTGYQVSPDRQEAILQRLGTDKEAVSKHITDFILLQMSHPKQD